jgi:hypothetical protein
MNNVHENAPILFQTRWVMSYLCGPLTRTQIKTLMDPRRADFQTASADSGAPESDAAGNSAAAPPTAGARRPIVPAGIREKFLAIEARVPDDYRLEYRPGLVGKGKVHFVRKSDGIDVWRTCYLLQASNDTPPDDVWQGATVSEEPAATEDQPDDRGEFLDLPAELARDKSYTIFARQLKEHLYREESLKLWQCERIEATSKPGEQDADFRNRLGPQLAERLASERAKRESAFATKLMKMEGQIRTAQTRVSTRRWQFFARLGTMAWVAFDTVMSAMGKNLPGRRRSIDPAIRSVATESGQQSHAKAQLENLLQQKQQIEQQHQEELKQLEFEYSVGGLKLERLELKPQKGDIEADEVALVWLPFRVSPFDAADPVFHFPVPNP